MQSYNPSQAQKLIVAAKAFADWLKRLDTPSRCILFLIPGMLFVFIDLRENGSYGLLLSVAYSILKPITMLFIISLIFVVGTVLISSSSPSSSLNSVVTMCACVATYFLILQQQFVGAHAQIRIREALMDRAHQHLIEDGQRLTLPSFEPDPENRAKG
jgi:hypothetical protein